MRKYWISLAISLALVAAGATLFLIRGPRLQDSGDGTAAPVVRSGEADEPVPAAVPAAGELVASKAAAEKETPPAAALHGKVSDLSGAGISGASVLVIAAALPKDMDSDSGARARLFRERFLGMAADAGRRRSVAGASTGEDGLYSIPLASIPPGDYQVLARHAGHVPA